MIPTRSVEVSDRRAASWRRCVASRKCTQDRADHDPAKANNSTARVVCRAALVARLGAGAVLAEAGVFVLVPDGRLHFRALPWLANEEQERREEIAAAVALGWSGEETLRWFIERANGVTVEICEPFEVEGDSLEQIIEGLMGFILARSLEAPQWERQEVAADERRATIRARSKGRAKGGRNHA